MFFVDTNILVYLHDSKEPEKQARATRIMEHLWRSGSGRLSFQVLFEFYAVVTRKLRPGLAPATARQEIQELLDWEPLAPSPALLDRAWQLEDRYGFSWWDSLIVAAAIAQGCTTLLSEDLQHSLVIDDLRVINPFHSAFQIDDLIPRPSGKPMP
jgi:predicted nucleic acid-binding protein